MALNANGRRIIVRTDRYTADKNIYSTKGRTLKEVNARRKAIPNFKQILLKAKYTGEDTNITGLDSKAKKGVRAMLHFSSEYEGYNIDILFRDKGNTQYLYEMKFIDKKSSQQSIAEKTAFPAPNGDVENSDIIQDNGADVKQRFSVDDAEYLSLAEKYRDGTASEKETAQQQEMVEQAANKIVQRGYLDAEDR